MCGRSRTTQAMLTGNGSSTGAFQYDSPNRVLSETQNGKVVASQYDGVGNRLKLTRPDGSYITYQPDALNRIDTIKDQLSQTIADYDYAGPGRVARRSYLNGAKLDVSYDSVKNITSYLNRDSTNADLASFEYGYDKVHNRKYEKRLHGGGIGDVCCYDDIYRLVKIKYNVPDPVNDIGTPSSTVDSNYDGLGNRDSVVTDSAPTYYTHNNMNEYDDVGGVTQLHDNNGNLIDDGTYLYTWDYENRLIEVRLKADNSLVAHYYYDALSRRIEKQTPTQTTGYYYDGAYVIEERDGTDTVLADYTYGRRIDEILTMKRGGQTYYYHTNALGSVSAVTNSTGAVVERYSYTVYGQMSITDGQGNPLSSSTIGNPYGFTGRRCDEETGLWYYRNRYYDAVTGRFTSRDPIGYLDRLNLYEYVAANPSNLTDPLGLHEDEHGEHDPPLGTGPGMAGRPGHWHPIAGFPRPIPHYHLGEEHPRRPLDPHLYQQWEDQYPLYPLAPATWAYNCGGYVFGEGQCWIENRYWWPLLQRYYHLPGQGPGVPPPPGVTWPAMIIVYGNQDGPQHVAAITVLILPTPIGLLPRLVEIGKWGEGPLYISPPGAGADNYGNSPGSGIYKMNPPAETLPPLNTPPAEGGGFIGIGPIPV